MKSLSKAFLQGTFVWGIVTGVLLPAQAAFMPLPLGTAANTSRMDERADDRRGGWLDKGGNDLRILAAGKLVCSDVPFIIPALSGETNKSCIVLGLPDRGDASKEVTLRLDTPAGGDFLYLLHAYSGKLKPQELRMVGEFKITFSDGSKQEYHVRYGRDVGDWTIAKSYPNAARAWTEYNNNTQVSLFISRFSLRNNQKIRSIKFEHEEKNTSWMILGATVGEKKSLRPIRSQLVLDTVFRAPPPLEKQLPLFPAGAIPKNVILIIGDGMGQGALRLASLYQHHKSDVLLANSLPIATLCTTFSANSDVTDSAASATAFATGFKTHNGVLGMLATETRVPADPPKLFSYAELAHRAGRSVGLITSDKITGATPGGFYAHVRERNETMKIAEQVASCGYEVLAGSDSTAAFTPTAAGGKRADARNLIREMCASDYCLFTNNAQFATLPMNKKAVGFLHDLFDEEALSSAVAIALPRLAQNEKGFFLMAECAITDGGGHANLPALSVRGVLQVDWMIRAALDFALPRGDTLILVTADHETGGLSCLMDPFPPYKITAHYSTTSHTGTPVALYAFGPGAELFSGIIDNTDIAKNIARLWNIPIK